MLIVLATGVMTMTLPDGTTQTVNLDNVVDVIAQAKPQIIYGSTSATPGTGSIMATPPGNPPVGGISTTLQSTLTYNYSIFLHFNDNRWLELECGKQTGTEGANWVNTLIGANIGVTDIKAVM